MLLSCTVGKKILLCIFFLKCFNHIILPLLTISTGREFQIFTILLKKSVSLRSVKIFHQ